MFHTPERKRQHADHVRQDVALSLRAFDLTSRQTSSRPDGTPYKRRRVLKKTKTCSDPDFQLLEDMNRTFNSECASGSGFVLGRSVCRETWTWLLQRETFFPQDGEVVGYVVVSPKYIHKFEVPEKDMLKLLSVPDMHHKHVSTMIANLPTTLPMLAQIYVQPSCRGRGLATESLRILCRTLSEHKVFQHQALVVHDPHPAIRKALETIGFKLVSVRADSEGKAITLFFKEWLSGTPSKKPRMHQKRVPEEKHTEALRGQGQGNIS